MKSDSLNWRQYPIWMTGWFLIFVVQAKEIIRPDYLRPILHWEKSFGDLHTYYRGWILVGIASIMLAIIILDMVKSKSALADWKNALKEPIKICALLMGLMVILSHLSSDFKEVSLTGAYITGEGTLHWLSYIILFLYTSHYINKKSIEVLAKGIACGVTILFLTGMLEVFGVDLFKSELFIRLITLIGDPIFGYDNMFMGRFATFLGNPNHVGSLVAVLLPFFIAYPMKWNEKNLYYWALPWMLYTMLAFSRSSAGLVGIIASLVLFLIYLLKSNSLNRLRHSVLIIGFVLIYMLSSVVMGGGSISDEIAGLKTMSSTSNIPSKLVAISSEPELITFDYLNYEIQVQRVGDDILFLHDGVVQDIGQFDEGERIGYKVFNENRVKVEFYFTDPSVMELHIDNNAYFIVNTPEAMVLKTRYMEEIPKNEVPSVGFEGKERFASSRGYIWSRTIPLLSETMLLGKGADTFALYFSQHDLFGKTIAFGNYNQTVDKPHNIYLMIAHNYGGIALVLFITMLLVSLVLVPLKVSLDSVLLSCTLLGGMLATWLFNDSMVMCSFYFWIIFAIVSSMNRLREA